MYYPFFVTYLIVGFSLGLLVFFWALKNGQFRDQQRARYLPLDEEGPQPVRQISRNAQLQSYILLGRQISRNAQLQSYILLGLVGFGLLAIAWVVIYAYLI
jgi:cbb3-type cytochrome oxidase maturation protein